MGLSVLLALTVLLPIIFGIRILLYPWEHFGDTAHCACCDYIVDGLPGPRCPECGSDVRRVGVIRGDRRLSPMRIGFGVFLILCGLLVAGAVVAWAFVPQYHGITMTSPVTTSPSTAPAGGGSSGGAPSSPPSGAAGSPRSTPLGAPGSNGP